MAHALKHFEEKRTLYGSKKCVAVWQGLGGKKKKKKGNPPIHLDLIARLCFTDCFFSLSPALSTSVSQIVFLDITVHVILPIEPSLGKHSCQSVST